jgi:hypothetical protein
MPVDVATRVIELHATKYFDFNVKHFHEKLVSEHGFKLGYSWTKRVLQEAGQVKPAKKRGAHRRKRPRQTLPGMMLHQDGSRHHWVPDVEWDLIVTMDDATSEIYSAFLVEQEGTMSSFQALREVIDTHRLFGALYADRGSHYWITKAAGQGIDKDNPTQVKRALDQLGITLIPGLGVASARALGAHVRYAARAAAAGAAGGRYYDHGSGQPVSARGLPARSQRRLPRPGGRAGHRLHRLRRT